MTSLYPQQQLLVTPGGQPGERLHEPLTDDAVDSIPSTAAVGVYVSEYASIVLPTAKQRTAQWYTFETDSIDWAAGANGSSNGGRFTGQGVINTGDATTGRSAIRTKNGTSAGVVSQLVLTGVTAGSATRHLVRAAENWWFKVLILQLTAPVGGTQEYYSGFHLGGTGLRDGIYFRAQNTGNWFLVCRNAGVETSVNLGIAPTTTLILLEFRISNDGGKVQAYYNNRVVGAAIYSNIPTGTFNVIPLFQDNRAATVTTAGIINCYGFGIAGDLVA